MLSRILVSSILLCVVAAASYWLMSDDGDSNSHLSEEDIALDVSVTEGGGQHVENKGSDKKRYANLKTIFSKKNVSTPVNDGVYSEEEAYDDKAPRVSIASLNDLVTYLEMSTPETLDLDSISDFINESPEAFEYIASEYRQSQDPQLKQVMLSILDNSNLPEKTAFALELLSSESRQERSRAYKWLARSDSANKVQVYGALLDAMNYEDSEIGLVSLMSAIVIPNSSEDPASYQTAISKFRQLAFHESETVSREALHTLAELEQNDATLAIIQSHMQSSSEEMKLAALSSLSNFDHPGEDMMDNLNAIVSNPSNSQQMRKTAVDLVVAFENYTNPPEDSFAAN